MNKFVFFFCDGRVGWIRSLSNEYSLSICFGEGNERLSNRRVLASDHLCCVVCCSTGPNQKCVFSSDGVWVTCFIFFRRRPSEHLQIVMLQRYDPQYVAISIDLIYATFGATNKWARICQSNLKFNLKKCPKLETVTQLIDMKMTWE